MSKTSEVRCTNPNCILDIEKYGENYHRVRPLWNPVPSFMPDATDQCESCGGYWNGKQWLWQCSRCNKEVPPGRLTGLFVPYVCSECHDALWKAEVAAGKVCGMCRRPYMGCCC